MAQHTTSPDRKDSKVLVAFLYLSAYGLLLSLYASYVVPYWSYLGYEFALAGPRVVLAALLITAFVIVTPQDSSVRSLLLNILLTIYLLPSLVIYSAGNGNLASSIIIWSAVATVYLVSAVPLPRMYVINVRTRTLMWIVAVITACFIALFVVLGGYRNFNININAVYEFRRTSADDLPGIFGYLRPIFSNVVIPFGIATALVHKKYALVSLFSFSAFMMFGFTSHKSILFTPIVVIGVYYLLMRFGGYSALLIAFIGALFISQIDVLLIRGPDEEVFGWYSSLLTRRVLMQRALIEYQYLDFFSETAKYYWTYSRITFGLVPDPHGINAPRLIGEMYYGSDEANANTGFVGSGYAQAGLWGVLLYSVGVGLIFSFLQSYSRYMSMPYVVAAASSFVLVIFAADFLTLFMTHGMLILMFLFMIVRSPQAEASDRAKAHASVKATLQVG